MIRMIYRVYHREEDFRDNFVEFILLGEIIVFFFVKLLSKPYIDF